MHNKSIVYSLAAIVLLLLAVACQPASDRESTLASTPADAARPLRIVATVLPIENLVLAITAGAANVEVTGLLPPAGGCPHDYALTPSDMKKLETADVLVAVGLDYEPFLGKLHENFGEKLPVILGSAQVEILPLKKDGEAGKHHDAEHHHEAEDHHEAEHHHEAEDHHEAEHHHEAEDHHEAEHRHEAEGHHEAEPYHHHGEVNDHPFVSPRQAAVMARTIAARLAQLSPANETIFQANAAKLVAELSEVHADLATFVAALPNKRVVAVSPIFGYLLRDAGLETAAVLVTHHHDTLSAAHLSELTKRFRAHPPVVVLNEKQFDGRVAQGFGEEIKVKVATLSSPFDAVRGPAGFVEQMRQMAGELKAALQK